MEKKPYTVRRTTWNRRPAILLTFTGKTESEYDTFLDARFTEGGEPIGFRRDSAAPHGRLFDDEGREQFHLQPFQFRAEPKECRHKFGPVEIARYTGNPYRRCEYCPQISLDLTDE